MRIGWGRAETKAAILELAAQNGKIKAELDLIAVELRGIRVALDSVQRKLIEMSAPEKPQPKIAPRREPKDPSAPPEQFAAEPWAKDVAWEKVY